MQTIRMLDLLKFASKFEIFIYRTQLFSAFNSLISFLNDEKNIDVKTCYDPLFLLGSDKTPEDAIHFLGVVRSLRFQCGAGFYRNIYSFLKLKTDLI
jgi:hypothetical protein